MALHPFRLPSAELSASIVMDASTVEDTTVTVAVTATREEELDVLETLYDYGESIGFKPFYEKAHGRGPEERRPFCENVIEAQGHRIAAFLHQYPRHGNLNTQQIEAVHSAIHVDDLLEDAPADTLVIVDGDENKAQPFVRALSGLRDDRPPVVNCFQSEFYYPTALVADLAANYLANSIEHGQYDFQDPILTAPPAKSVRSSQWGQAFAAMYDNSLQYSPPDLQTMRGDSVRERICCWYEGAVASAGGDLPVSDSLNPVSQALRREGYDELADTLAQL